VKETIKGQLKRHPRLDRWVRLYMRRKRALSDGYPDWERIIGADRGRWEAALRAAGESPRVLVATSVGGFLAGATLESLLAVALTLRGARVEALLCDAALPACLDCDVTWYPAQRRFVERGPGGDLCRHCFSPAEAMFRGLGLRVHRYGEQVTPEDRRSAARLSADLPAAEIPAYRVDGAAVGEHALAGALRFFASASLEGEPFGEAVLRRYFEAALLATVATRGLLRRERFDVAVFHHGIYVPQGLVGEVARQEGVRVVNWNPAYRKRCFIFSHGDTYHHTLMSEPTDAWEGIPWGPPIEAKLLEYLKSRWQGSEDWIWFHERPQFDRDAIAREIGVDFSKPCVGMLTNVTWDAQLHYPANAFPNMLTWALRTIGYFARRPDLQLVVRAHPAEVRGTLPSRQPVLAEIRRAYPELPRNCFLVPPESSVSTYAVMDQCNAVIIYGTKTGVELTSMGVPVVVAGEAWIRNKGVTMDAASEEDYFRILDRLPLAGRLDPETTARARKYAYHFFFRRMIPLDCMEPTGGSPPFRVRSASLDALAPGGIPGLDVICEGILRGAPFVFRDEAALAPAGA
jgi:hypothetical protein